MFYFKLAVTNIRTNKRVFAPFILATAAMMIMNVVMLSSYFAAKSLFVKSGNATAPVLFGLGAIVIAIFTVIFTIYANSFLLKQRTKQLALYNVIGFGKRELLRMTTSELGIVWLCAITFGGVFGTAFARISYLTLRKVLMIPQHNSFGTSPLAILLAAGVLTAVFLLLIIIDAIWIHRHQPLEMMRAVSAGEREPKTNLPLVIIGVLTLAAGYGIALTIKNPIQALAVFFVAVVLVVIGTYALFTAGSIFVYKRLRKNHKYYYQPRHFINVANMIHRMRQNGAGLASIAVLVTMTLVTVASVLTLYLGIDQIVTSNAAADFTYSAPYKSSEAKRTFAHAAKKRNVRINSSITLATYNTISLTWQNRQSLRTTRDADFNALTGTNGNMRSIAPTTIADYNATYGTNIQLQKNEVLLWDTHYSTPKNVKIAGINFTVKATAKKPPFGIKDSEARNDTFIVFASQAAYARIAATQAMDSAMQKTLLTKSNNIFVNVTGTQANQLALTKDLQRGAAASYVAGLNSRAETRNELLGVMGAFLFMGIMLGLMFMMATALILYYKQVSEGLADAKRFAILQQVGLSHKEVRQTINSQLLTLFYIPLIVAAVHTAVAAVFEQRIFVLFGITNWLMYASIIGVTLIAFAIVYILLYKSTARVYYKLVARN